MPTLIIRPNGAGSETNIPFQEPAGSGYHWDKVDEAAADDNTTYVYYDDTDARRDLYALPDRTSELGGVVSVTHYIRCQKNNNLAGAYAKTSIKTNGNIYDGAQNDLVSGVWTNYWTEYVLNPATSLPWTWDEVNALEGGVVLAGTYGETSTQSQCTQVYTAILYTSPVGVAGHFWVEANNWHYLDAEGAERSITGAVVSFIGQAAAGFFWVAKEFWNYIDSSGYHRRLIYPVQQ